MVSLFSSSASSLLSFHYSWSILGIIVALIFQLFSILQEIPNNNNNNVNVNTTITANKEKQTDEILTKIFESFSYDDDDDDDDDNEIVNLFKSNPDDGLVFDYTIIDLQSVPSGTGYKLKLIAWIVTKSWFFSPFLLRNIINQNGIHHVRQLVSSKSYINSLPPTHYPIHKATQQQMEISNEWNKKYYSNKNDEEELLLSFFSSSDDNNDDNDSSTTTTTTTTGKESNTSNSSNTSSNNSNINSNNSNSNYRTVFDYNNLYKSGQVTPSIVMEHLILGVTTQLQHLHIFSCFRPNHIRQQALASNERWLAKKPLSIWDGVPVAIKDQSPVSGLKTCHGSSECIEWSNDEDDIPSEYLKNSGAIIIGMTIMTEGGVTPLGYNAHPIHDGPFNPYSPTKHYCGGSSGGSAVAVSTGLTVMSVGWDGGGSIRIPSAMSGVIGLAPTFGRISFEKSNMSTNIKAGPICSSMIDIALSYLLLGQVYNTTSTTSTTSTTTGRQQDGRRQQRRRRRKKVFYNELFGEAYLPPPHLTRVFVPPSLSSSSSNENDNDKTLALPSKNQNPNQNNQKPLLDGIRLGIFWDHFQHTEKEVYEKCLQVVEFLQSPLIGATIVNITIPYLKEIHLSHGIKILSEFGLVWEKQFYNSSYILESNTEISIKLGRTITADEVLAAEKIRTFGILYVRNIIFKTLQIDSILSPALGDKVPKLPTAANFRGYGESNVPLIYKIMRYVPLANFLGLPALSIPIGYHDNDGNDSDDYDTDYIGLPIGFQFMADAWNEPMLIKLGFIIEQYYLTRNSNNNNNDNGGGGGGGGSTIRKPPNENFFDVLKPWLG